MIPEGGETSGVTCKKDDVMLAGYKECATEALTWLLNLGYEPGHPLIRSLAAHLTKKQAYLEKLSLERFLIEDTLMKSREDGDDDLEEEEYEGEGILDEDEEDSDSISTYEVLAQQIKENADIQRALVDAVFKGCDLQYSKDSA